MVKNPPFCYFTSFSTALLATFIKKKNNAFERRNYFTISSISSFENTRVVPEPKKFFGIDASVADVAAVNPNVTKKL